MIITFVSKRRNGFLALVCNCYLFGKKSDTKIVIYIFILDDPILCSSTPIPTSKDAKQRRLSTDKKSSAAKCAGNKESSLEDDQESQRQKLIDSVVMKNR